MKKRLTILAAMVIALTVGGWTWDDRKAYGHPDDGSAGPGAPYINALRCQYQSDVGQITNWLGRWIYCDNTPMIAWEWL